ncbi:MAG: hypothetical protein MUE54_07610, partial [Anaerolineae bacterium]|nr:hypothetical protein [Anaerolineae bacterium]
ISFKEVELTSEEAKSEFGDNAQALVIELTGNNRVEVFGSGEEIGSLISILCEPSALQKSIETVIDKFLTPQEREDGQKLISTEQMIFETLEEKIHGLNKTMAEALESIGERIDYLESGFDSLKGSEAA